MSVNLKFNSETMERTASKKITSRTYYDSSLSSLESFIQESFPEGSDSEIGRITRNRFYQKGPTWFCDVTGEADYDEDGIRISVNPDGESQEAQKHQLRTIVVPIPLNSLSTYRTYWDHYLWIQRINNETVNYSETYKNKTSDIPFYDSSGRKYAWSETVSDALLPELPENSVWYLLASPSKPGIRYVEYLTYQITEYGEYTTESAASWAVSNVLNTIRTKPPMGDMGVRSTGTWKLDSATIRYNGSRWEAACVWTCRNWDRDLYPASQS